MIVLGIGNVLMRDDGIGVYLTEALREKKVDERVKFIIGETDVDFCLSEIEGARFLIVVDAVQLGGETGKVHEFKLAELSVMDRGIAAHNEHLFQSIRFRNGVLLGIEAFDISFHYGLSHQLEQLVPSLISTVGQRIKQIADRELIT